MRDKPVTYLEGRCLSYGSAIPYVPILDVIKQNFGIVDADVADAIGAKVWAGIEEVGLDPAEAGPVMLLLLGVKEGTERIAALTSEAVKARTFDALRQLSLAGGRRRTLVLAAGSANASVSRLIFSGLFSVDRNGNLAADMAESWKADDTGKNYMRTPNTAKAYVP